MWLPLIAQDLTHWFKNPNLQYHQLFLSWKKEPVNLLSYKSMGFFCIQLFNNSASSEMLSTIYVVSHEGKLSVSSWSHAFCKYIEKQKRSLCSACFQLCKRLAPSSNFSTFAIQHVILFIGTYTTYIKYIFYTAEKILNNTSAKNAISIRSQKWFQ